MPDAAEKALVRFKDGYNCCQSVLSCLCDRYGLNDAVAIRLATGFGAGMARGGICGVVSGAAMLLGLAGGGGGHESQALKMATFGRVKDFYGRFTERHGSILCRDLLGLDPSTPEGRTTAREEGLFTSVCDPLIVDAVSLVQAIMAESGLPERR